MKCIACGTNNRLKDRAGRGRCRKCNHRFVFEPTTMREVSRFTDVFFQQAVADISVNDTLFFTAQQLTYLINRRLQRRQRKQQLSVMILLVVLFAAFSGTFFLILIVLLANILGLPIGLLVTLTLLGVALFIRRIRKRQIEAQAKGLLATPEQVSEWLYKWASVNGSTDKLLLAPAQEFLPSSSPLVTDAGIIAYSFDRLVICQSDRIAQMLIANNFHFENSCAVLSVSGYPQRIFDTTLEMLRLNQSLQVYAFHDCSLEGITLAHQMRNDPRWFPEESVTIVDVGLLPSQILAAKRGIFIQNARVSETDTARLIPAVRQGLSAAELQWLSAGNFVVLESFSPKKLIQVLQQGIAKSQRVNLEEDNRLTNRLTLSEDSGGSGLLYTVDSFG